jgi:hypothetical protein
MYCSAVRGIFTHAFAPRFRAVARCDRDTRSRELPPSKEILVPGAGRLGDKANVVGPGDVHGCPACPHPAIGPAISGSPDVNVNRRPALRVDDVGIHMACCGTNTWTAKQGAPTVFINGKAAHRMNDMGQSCGGVTKLIEGSPNVIVGDAAGGGGGVGPPGATIASGGGAGGIGGRGGSSGASSATGGSAGATGSTGPADGAAAGPGAGSGATAATSASPAQSATTPQQDAKDLDVQLVNALGDPRPGVRFEVTLPDGSVKSGESDDQGYIRITGIQQGGTASLVLPEIDELVKR